jgi:hypothetical protein
MRTCDATAPRWAAIYIPPPTHTHTHLSSPTHPHACTHIRGRTICEKMSTRWPSERSLGSSLSRSTSLPLQPAQHRRTHGGGPRHRLHARSSDRHGREHDSDAREARQLHEPAANEVLEPLPRVLRVPHLLLLSAADEERVVARLAQLHLDVHEAGQVGALAAAVQEQSAHKQQ